MDPNQKARDYPVSSAQPSEQAPEPSQPKQPTPADAPRTDLTPEKEPYYDGYFGTEEESGVEREEDDADASGDGPSVEPPPEQPHP